MANTMRCLFFVLGLTCGVLSFDDPGSIPPLYVDNILAQEEPQKAPGNEFRTLQLVHILTRHGIRTPTETFPKDPNINFTYWPTGMGELTNPGKLESYKMGQYIRKRYSKFLDRIYTPDVYYSTSTDVDRTIATTQTINAGLWYPKKLETWGPIRWQPVPTHTIPFEEDYLLLGTKMCNGYFYEIEKYLNSTEYLNDLATYNHTFERVEEVTGFPMKKFKDAESIHSILEIQRHWNLTLPEWWIEWYPQLREPAAKFFLYQTANPTLKKYKGFLLKKFIEDWKAKRDGTLKPRQRQAFLYGGHDVTVANFMRVLNLWELQVPRFGIFVLLELWKDKRTHEWGVEIYLRNETLHHPYLMTLPGCESFCPLDKFIELTKDVIPGTWEEECAKAPPGFKASFDKIYA